MLRTPLCDALGVQHPIIQAGMAGTAGANLAAAVSSAGALGNIGGTSRLGPDWLRDQIRQVRAATDRPFAVTFITFLLEPMPAMLDVALEEGAPIIVLSFGDPAPYLPKVRAAGATAVCQVQRVEEAARAVDLGAQVIIAQGTEAGGHTGRVSTLPLVPQVVDAVPGVPVVAAGGIADGRGLAAVLALGAQGAVMGTRFVASRESDTTEGIRSRVVQAGASDTVLTDVFDIAIRVQWPEGISGRSVRNPFTDRWHGRDDELRANLDAVSGPAGEAFARGDPDAGPVYAGEVSGMIRQVESAGDIVRRVAAEAEAVIRDRLTPLATRA